MPFKAYAKINSYNKKGNCLLFDKGEIIDVYDENEAIVYACKNNFNNSIKFINECKEKYNNSIRKYSFTICDNTKSVYAYTTLLRIGDYEKILDKEVLKALGDNTNAESISEYEIYDIEIMKCLSMLQVDEGSKNTIRFKLVDSDGNIIKDDYYMKDSFTYDKEKNKTNGSIYGTHTVRGNEVIVDCDEHSANIILKAIHMKAFKIKYVGNEDADGLFKDDVVFDGSPDKQDSIEKEILVNDKKNSDINYSKVGFIGFVIIAMILIIMKLLGI